MALTQEQLNRILGKQSVVQRAFEDNQPTVSAQRPSSPSLSAISNVLETIRKPLDVYGLNKNIPFVGGTTFADVTGLNQVAPLTQDVAYGRPVMRGGSLQTMQADPRLAGLVDFIPAAGVAAKAGQVGTKAGAREIARQIETGTGVFGKGTIDPRMNIVPVDVAKQFNMKTTLPKSDEFISAVQGTKGAEITPEGLKISLQRFQKPEQELAESVRTGVFYLPEGSANIKYYKNKGTSSSGNPYGGSDLIQGETIYKNPLFVKGATGGKAPEEAYKQLLGKDKFNEFQKYVKHAASAPYKMREEVAYDFLQRYAPEISDNAWNIVQNSNQGNQLRYALQEAVIANEARKAGHDVILGYSTGKNGPRISEAFDLRESHYPSPSGEFYMHPEYEGLLGK